jgi:hypothetical protein
MREHLRPGRRRQPLREPIHELELELAEQEQQDQDERERREGDAVVEDPPLSRRAGVRAISGGRRAAAEHGGESRHRSRGSNDPGQHLFRTRNQIRQRTDEQMAEKQGARRKKRPGEGDPDLFRTETRQPLAVQVRKEP